MTEEKICPICGKSTTKDKYEEIKKEYPDLIEFLENQGVKSIVELGEEQEETKDSIELEEKEVEYIYSIQETLKGLSYTASRVMLLIEYINDLKIDNIFASEYPFNETFEEIHYKINEWKIQVIDELNKILKASNKEIRVKNKYKSYNPTEKKDGNQEIGLVIDFKLQLKLIPALISDISWQMRYFEDREIINKILNEKYPFEDNIRKLDNEVQEWYKTMKQEIEYYILEKDLSDK
jgi:hypothetical protein